MPPGDYSEGENVRRQSDVVLARLDERTKHILGDIEEIKKKLEFKYVTQDEFKPVKMWAYRQIFTIGASGLSIAGVIALLIKEFLMK